MTPRTLRLAAEQVRMIRGNRSGIADRLDAAADHVARLNAEVARLRRANRGLESALRNGEQR
jgi:hypothetical protein